MGRWGVVSGVMVVAMVNLVQPLLRRVAARFGGAGRGVQGSRRSGLEAGDGQGGRDVLGRAHRGRGRATAEATDDRAWRGSRYWVAGGFDKILLNSDQTGGTLGVTETEETRGTGPPLHVHALEDEAYYVIEGSYTFFIGDETITAPPLPGRGLRGSPTATSSGQRPYCLASRRVVAAGAPTTPEGRRRVRNCSRYVDVPAVQAAAY